MLCHGQKKQIARAAWHCHEIRVHLCVEVAKQIHKQCVAMCVRGAEKKTKRRKDSGHRRTDKKSILDFKFDNLVVELGERAPLLLLVLKTASLQVNNGEERWIPAVCIAAATCLRNVSRNMIALKLIIALINHHSGFMVGRNYILLQI